MHRNSTNRGRRGSGLAAMESAACLVVAVAVAVAAVSLTPAAHAASRAPVSAGAPPLIEVAVANSGGAYSVSVNGSQWLQGGNLAVFVNEAWHQPSDGSLTLQPGTKWPVSSAGSDAAGSYVAQTFGWCAAAPVAMTAARGTTPSGGCAAGATFVTTAIKTYTTWPAVSFVVTYPDGAIGTNPLGNTSSTAYRGSGAPPAQASARFPSFSLDPARLGPPQPSNARGAGNASSLRYTTVFGSQTSGVAFGDASTYVPAGIDAGPVTLTVTESAASYTGGPSVVVSSTTEVMTAQQDVSSDGWWSHGPGGELTALPVGFSQETVLVAAHGGPNAAMATFGQYMQTLYGTKRRAEMDHTLDSLGYWSDNGAYYYFFEWKDPLALGTPAEVLVNVTKSLAHDKVPVRYLQLDAWWYACDGWNACIEDFAPHPGYFPQGLQAFSSALGGLKLQLYDNYICPKNAYTAQGIRFLTTDNGRYSLPVAQDSEALYALMFAEGAKQQMMAFEVDYLSTTSYYMSEFRRNVSAARGWLAGMDAAAKAAGVPVQYCMATPRYLLQSLAFDSVTNARASRDFKNPGNLETIGYSSILHHALGLRPSKDNFWTTMNQPSRGGVTTVHHANPVLHALVAAMSTGPVGPSDAIGHTDVELVMRTCDSAGNLIQPDAPLRAIDATFFAPPSAHDAPSRAAGAASPDDVPWHWNPRGPVPGQVWATDATLSVAGPGMPAPEAFSFRSLLAFNVTQHYTLWRGDALPPISDMVGAVVMWRQWDGGEFCRNNTIAGASGCVLQWPPTPNGHPGSRARTDGVTHVPGWAHPLANAMPDAYTGGAMANGTYPHKLVTTYPVLPGGWVFLGDLTKFAAISSGRFPSVNVTEVQGSAGGATVMRVAVRGGPEEAVRVTAVGPAGYVMVHVVTLSDDGTGVATFDSRDVPPPEAPATRTQ